MQLDIRRVIDPHHGYHLTVITNMQRIELTELTCFSTSYDIYAANQGLTSLPHYEPRIYDRPAPPFRLPMGGLENTEPDSKLSISSMVNNCREMHTTIASSGFK